MNWKEILETVWFFATGAGTIGLIIYGFVIARKVDRIVSNLERELNEPDEEQQESEPADSEEDATE